MKMWTIDVLLGTRRYYETKYETRYETSVERLDGLYGTVEKRRNNPRSRWEYDDTTSAALDDSAE